MKPIMMYNSSMTTDSLENHYDVIVMGAGLGGLSAAAQLAKAGRKVLLVEKEPRAGGYFSPIVHGSYYFNNGPRLLMGCNADGPNGPGIVHTFLEELGVRQQCEFIPIQPFTTIRMPDLELCLWSGRKAFIEGIHKASPGGIENLPELLNLCGRIHQAALSYYRQKKPWEMVKSSGSLMEALLYQNVTLEDGLRRYIPQAGSRNIVGAIWPFFGLPPWRASFFYWAVLMATYIDDGAYFCKGGLHQLTDVIAGAFVRDGGELLLGSSIENIMVQDGSVKGVVLGDGRRVFAPAVIAAIDPRQVFGRLIDPKNQPQNYLRKLGRMEPSIRGVNISLVTDLDLPRLGLGYETLVVDNWNIQQTWQDLEAGLPSVFGLTLADVADPDLSPPGYHLLKIFASLPTNFAYSNADIQQYTDNLVAVAEQHIPGLRDHLVLARNGEVAGGYLTSVYEPIYGWASSPEHAALRRLSPKTPVRGLILAGQWTRPGHGAIGVVLSGLNAARQILR